MKTTLCVLGGLLLGIAFGIYGVMPEKRVGRQEDYETFATVVIFGCAVFGLIAGALIAFVVRDKDPEKPLFPKVDPNAPPKDPTGFIVLSIVMWFPGFVYLVFQTANRNAPGFMIGAVVGSFIGIVVWCYVIRDAHRRRLAKHNKPNQST